MQIETSLITKRSFMDGAKPGEKKLDFRNKRHITGRGHTWHQDFTAENCGDAYFAKPYGFNTKYVVDVEHDPEIGCRITLTSGRTVWVDETVTAVTHACNRR